MKLKKFLKSFIPHSLLDAYWDYKLKKKKYFGRNKIDAKLLEYLNYENGFFVELGANDGLRESNSYYFEKNLNWKGILIEPVSKNFEKCKKNRSYKNFFFNTACVSFSYTKKTVDLIFSDLMTVPINLESDNKIFPEKHAKLGEKYLEKNQKIKKITAEAKTLNEILVSVNSPKLIDFLSLDVEGSEIEVLKGINHNLFSFKYILVECRDLEKMKVYLKKFGYDLILDLKNFDYLFKKNI